MESCNKQANMEIEQQTDAYTQTTASRWRQTDRWKERRKNRKRNKKMGILVEVLDPRCWWMTPGQRAYAAYRTLSFGGCFSEKLSCSCWARRHCYEYSFTLLNVNIRAVQKGGKQSIYSGLPWNVSGCRLACVAILPRCCFTCAVVFKFLGEQPSMHSIKFSNVHIIGLLIQDNWSD